MRMRETKEMYRKKMQLFDRLYKLQKSNTKLLTNLLNHECSTPKVKQKAK